MEASDTFLNCETLFYGLSLFEPTVMITDVYSTDDLLFLSNCGFSLVIMNGKVTLKGDKDAFAKLIKNEIEENLVNKYDDLAAYVYMLCANDAKFINDIKNVIEFVEMDKPIFAQFFHVFEFIIENWKLNDAESREYKKLKMHVTDEVQYPAIRKTLFNY